MGVETSPKEEGMRQYFSTIPYSLGGVVLVLRNSLDYSHSMVLGGLEEISYTTRLTPFTLLMISLETFAKNS